MNILAYHEQLINNYKSYIQSFLNIKDPGILNFVDKEIHNKKLWPEPLIQFNPTFEKGTPIKDLVTRRALHPTIDEIFSGYQLHRHQQEAIVLGAQQKEFIVTSGTGSGKSLTYITTIFNHILNSRESSVNKTVAVIVYPMNALINSQNEEIKKFERNYLKSHLPTSYEFNELNKNYDTQIKELREIVGDIFPIKYGQYTGQEDENARELIRNRPPHILLTNYMMLELLMTRGGDDIQVRNNILDNIKYLVFDELHTYRGRQGSDVSILIRRIKAGAQKKIICIGTSATIVSSDSTSIAEQKSEIAKIGSLIFGTDIEADQVIGEYLIRSLNEGVNISPETVSDSVLREVDINWSFEIFEKNETANWIEEYIALEKKEGIYVRRKPITINEIIRQLATYTGLDLNICKQHLFQILSWANKLNANPNKKGNCLPYRIHQFIAQTGAVYATLGIQSQRELFMDAGLYAANARDTFIFPLVFSRNSGHEYYCVNLSEEKGKIFPRQFSDTIDDEDEETASSFGYIFIQHKEDKELLWDEQRDFQDLPDSWFNPKRKDGSRSLKKERVNRIPRRIYFNKHGDFSFSDPLEFEGWYMTSPLMFDPTSGDIFDQRTKEWTKLMKLGGEGRSTATTVLSFEAITQLQSFGEPVQKQKILSFTDNRQDASLQAGHFNDFIKVGQLRAAITKALKKFENLDYTNIADKIFECLSIPQEQYAKNAAVFPGPKKENEDAFKTYIMYRLLYDLRRSWRVVMPNLEQCALLKVEYKHVDESVADNSLWSNSELLQKMQPDRRKEFLYQLFDFFRKSYALSYSMLEPSTINQNSTRIIEKLKAPWTLEETEHIEYPHHLHIEKLSKTAFNIFPVSGGYQSVFARYIKNTAEEFGINIRSQQLYTEFIYQLLNFLFEAGWLSRKSVKTESGENAFIYQLKVDNIIWSNGDGVTISTDLIKNRSYKPLQPRVNEYFKRFYQIDFHSVKPIEGREHTGQINSEKRKEREKEFRKGKIAALFCSPTMELGIDISDLSVVHMRNVPPSPANYAQRSGRAGRSGQAALVITYCSNISAHDRYYFNHPAKMITGAVSAPRMDLFNKELLRSHLYAVILTMQSISALKNSLGDLVNRDDLDNLPLKMEVSEVLTLNEQKKRSIHAYFKAVMNDSYFKNELTVKKAPWFNDEWINNAIGDYKQNFDSALGRWRLLYKNAILQFREANAVIENRIYAENHDKIKEAKNLRKQAERQMELLLNDPKEGASAGNSQSEFYPYRYLAAEGFLPGYNFTRLPIRSFLENREGSGEFVSRPRFIALREFGPRNIVYHDGSKYRVDRIILTEAEAKLEKAKVSPYTGYILMRDQYNYNVDPIVNVELSEGMDQYIHPDLIEMTETKSFEMQRITCQEEERTKRGYDTRTYFSVEGGLDTIAEAQVKLAEEKLLHIHSIPAARLVQINFKWKSSTEKGYALNLKNGYWQNQQQEGDAKKADDIRRVKLYTTTTANALYIQPVKALALKGGKNGIITLMYALKKAIENYFQVESSEVEATIMGESDNPNMMIYEAAEGSLGILSQIVDSPEVYKSVMKEAFNFCFVKNGIEIPEEDLLPATYDDLLSYKNQTHHQVIDRNLIRDSLRILRDSAVEVLTTKSYDSYDKQYQALQAERDPNSSTEEKFLQFLYNNGMKLPDEAQPKITNMFVRPDFFYKPNVCIFCDGTPHDESSIAADDIEKRNALIGAGYQILTWNYKEPLGKFIAKRPDIFKKVKSGVGKKTTEGIEDIFNEASQRFDITLKKLGE